LEKGPCLEKKKISVEPGTIRIKAEDLEPYEKTEKSWKKSSKDLSKAKLVIELFKGQGQLNVLIDTHDPRFLKGQLLPDGKTQGARINILPNGRKLDKAFSLFAENLTIHNESSNYHWNVIYKNPGGTYSYVYALDKKRKFVDKKYRVVTEFSKYYPKLKRNAYNALKKDDDRLAVPMYTLLKTYMRIGNEIYYKIRHHKGLTTLKKEDITINGKYVTFNYIAKDGVPTNITESFPPVYINRLRNMLEGIDNSSFVFTNGGKGRPLCDTHFKDAFKRYCGKEFYPHIVRSHYATSRVEVFLATHKSFSREEMRSLFLSIAEKLGHKRFVRKDNVWKDSYTITINHYVRPRLLKKIKSAAIIKPTKQKSRSS
jgi:DNA topoisomerase IB